ncbi:hypothetical protein ACRWTT_01560 [Escherichia coli]|nr:hypothetical protein [Escherichia coli]MCR6173368.1 hypothetical protein [Escherichia coli]MCR6177191.1 hypothetical protein [Escherichia coli]MCS1326403.1 hypothetical protein [Escherichia coli]MCS1340417.1 hypothetical protein [Escherichia coli]MCZ5468194.1 hypothetical protein [Escherichia coli]
MSVFMSWLILILAIICAVEIMRVINSINTIESLFTGDKRRK